MQMATKAVSKKKKLTLMNLKVSGAERKTMEFNSRRYTKGNVSEWLRIAGTKFRPTKKDLAS